MRLHFWDLFVLINISITTVIVSATPTPLASSYLNSRASVTSSHGKRSSILRLPLRSKDNFVYTELNIGGQLYQVLVATDSPVTWIGANKPYSPSSSSQNLSRQITGENDGKILNFHLYKETVTFGTISVENQLIGVVDGGPLEFHGLDGILGLGPSDGLSSIPADNLAEQKKVPASIMGISPPRPGSTLPGELTIGGPDSSRYTGPITWIGLADGSTEWTVPMGISYSSDRKPIMSNKGCAVILELDKIELPRDAFDKYKALTGSTEKPSGALTVPNTSALSPLNFGAGGSEYSFTPSNQAMPSVSNETPLQGPVELIVAASPNGACKLGKRFMNLIYTTIDTQGKVGFAPARLP